MKAIVKTKTEPGIEVLDVDVPEIGDIDILVKVAAGSLCGSDVHFYHWLLGSEIVRVPVILADEGFQLATKQEAMKVLFKPES